ncbi:trypsin-like peptidase domain-containing protein [Streptomyces sp. NPDC091266]|uniref:S1C family serine protease n=1 Tax=Streptomyces sp. NPDC091266 TaxID=3365978 RepID=UPI00380FE087
MPPQAQAQAPASAPAPPPAAAHPGGPPQPPAPSGPQGSDGAGFVVPPPPPAPLPAQPADRPDPAPPADAARPLPASVVPPPPPAPLPAQPADRPDPAPPADAARPLPAEQPDPYRPVLEKPGAPEAARDVGTAVDGAFVPVPGEGGPRPQESRTTPPPHPTGDGDHPAAPAPPRPQAHHHPAHPGPAAHGPDPLAPQGAWQQYDPWSAPQHGGPPAAPLAPRRGRRGLLVVGAVVLALLAGGVGGGIGAYVERNGGLGDIQLPQADDDEQGRNPESVAGIAQRALPGVVTLHVSGNTEQGTGTGFVLDRQGHLLTNNHVVEPAGAGGEISVTFSGGQTAKAKVIGQDSGYDLAVVQVEGVTGLRPLTLGNSDAVRVGDPVVAIGAPYDLANTVTAGIISAKQRPITAGGEKGDGSDVSYVDALQTDAPINPGNSGGPLVDAQARVIGINSAIRAADSGSGLDGAAQGGSIGLGFAIPINQAKRVAEELINTGRAAHPVIGVSLETEYAGDGARVSTRSKEGTPPVTPGGPGAKAGIKAGDVITKVDGAPVHGGEELIVKIRSHRPGDKLMVTLERDGKERTVRLTLGSAGTG